MIWGFGYFWKYPMFFLPFTVWWCERIFAQIYIYTYIGLYVYIRVYIIYTYILWIYKTSAFCYSARLSTFWCFGLWTHGMLDFFIFSQVPWFSHMNAHLVRGFPSNLLVWLSPKLIHLHFHPMDRFYTIHKNRQKKNTLNSYPIVIP